MATNPRVDPATDLIVPEPPRLPTAPMAWDSVFQDQYSNVLRLYFNRLQNLLQELTVPGDTPIYPGGTAGDAFGRLRVSNPYTLFDSQSRYAADDQFDTALTGSATTTYNANESTVDLNVTTASGDEVVRQTYRVFPYQPGKSLLVYMTFAMGAGKTGLRQRLGYFGAQNGIYLQQDGTTVSIVLRSYVTGSVVETVVPQSSWNGDKYDGTGATGETLDVTKTNILAMDIEWLGVGDVRVGFVTHGKFVVAHTFHNDNVNTTTYMTTAILPVRYEITNTDATASSSELKQICSTVISEGGYDETSARIIARRTSELSSISTTFLPLISIRLVSGREGAVVLPSRYQVQPTTSQTYEVVLIKNATLTGASWASTNSANVEYDQSATSYTGGTIVQQEYLTSTVQAGSGLDSGLVYNWDLQLGSTISGTSDIYTVAVRTLSSTPTGSAWASLTFFDITQ